MIEKKYVKYNTRENDLLVFSKESGQLYGFDQAGTLIFSFLEEKKGSTEELLQMVGESKTVRSTIHTISNILEGKEEPELSIDDLAYIYPEITSLTQYKNPFYYQFNTFIFVIDIQSELILEKILSALDHLRCDQEVREKISMEISFIADKNCWSICVNDTVLQSGLELVELLPRIQDIIRISYYRSTDYLISLHAGALYFNKVPLIMPAASGFGKSTLSTYLMYQKDFEFLTDEVAIIDKYSRICPVPMSITIKEGSWKTLESYDINLDNLPIHRRFDGQRLRFLPPGQVATESLKLDHAYLIFPHYVADASTEVTPLSTLESLDIITTSGYEVFNSYDEATIEQWIRVLERLKKYTITYSNLEEAQEHIERLMTT